MKLIYGLLGFICFVAGSIGFVLPVLPTTPFFLLATFFFARSSERFNRWFVSTKLYKKHLETFLKNREMTLKTKLCTIIPASMMLMLTFLVINNLFMRITLIFLIAFIFFYFFTRIKTVPPEDKANQESCNAVSSDCE